jgi:hypothetical protein
MINPLIHYELEMTTRQQEQLQRRVALWQLAHQAATDAHRLARPNWLRQRERGGAFIKGAETMLHRCTVARPKQGDDVEVISHAAELGIGVGLGKRKAVTN